MKVNLATVSAPQKTKIPASTERRSPARRGSRGDKFRMSPSVIVNIVQASDLLLMLFGGLLTSSMLAPPHAQRPDGSLFFATVTGSLVAGAFFPRAGAYQLASLCSLNKQLKLMPIPFPRRWWQHDRLPFPHRNDGLVSFADGLFFGYSWRAPFCSSDRDLSVRLSHNWTESLAGCAQGRSDRRGGFQPRIH